MPGAPSFPGFSRGEPIAGPLNNLGHFMEQPELLLIPLVALGVAIALMWYLEP
jgi:hypothetical protein